MGGGIRGGTLACSGLKEEDIEAEILAVRSSVLNGLAVEVERDDRRRTAVAGRRRLRCGGDAQEKVEERSADSAPDFISFSLHFW